MHTLYLMTEFLAFILGASLAGGLLWLVIARRTRRQQRQEQRLLLRTQRAERLAELGTLVGHLAHELRNPLSIVKVNLKLLLEEIHRQSRDLNGIDLKGLPIANLAQRLQRQQRKVETISTETDRLADTLTDFLKYAGRLELHPARQNINELIEVLTDFYEPQAISQGIAIRRNLCKTPAWCRIDADLIKQALLNLFINAAQAMGGEGDLIIQTHIAGEKITIDVIDTGPGISPGERGKIFDAYYTTKTGGSGLGLSTCRRIIEEHDGSIDLVSESGKGSSFTITLPLVE